MLECKSCGGRYEPIGADAVRYFHTCPPLSLPELKAAVDRGAVVLPKGESVDQAFAARIYERGSKRDENVTAARDAKGAAVIKAEGNGTLAIASVTPPAVVVVADV